MSILETFKSMSTIKDKLNQRIEDQYFGSTARQLLRTLPMNKQNKIVRGLCDFYLNLLKYLDKN